ncbi:hypothetical protein QCM77_42855, partial [Bradyrhizobium sp. SSUT18]|uniref:hypothetical protein n=1 Tax=Bradyrhizobium sp. SSUT18 TaxID=3040602 RepID=UPI002446EE1D
RRYCRPAALQLPQSRHCLNGPVSPDTSAIHQNRRRAEKIALTLQALGPVVVKVISAMRARR